MKHIKEVIVATRNVGKFREFEQALRESNLRIYSLSDLGFVEDIEEDDTSYVMNALKKARKIGDRFNLPSLADDSGLEVEYLKKRPGVKSARYGRTDEERIQRLLLELADVPWERRSAKFKAYLALYLPGHERQYIFYGELKGYIGFEKKEKYGFGYDPIFYVPDIGKFLSELSVEEKNEISHRGKALKALKKFLFGP
ncbi:MAG: RdgB/HAM1 family non-canonical purine NTP pyrophosphatase [Desulfobacterota bacterium]|nr:RdgB/HAM1 family non-canonical purine NTP pyrophosphatase [Thermodesulfobacteriota bacterium]MDW8001124.1 RdgB/HAM1 family non-canonical purine NTP pyrophosphatase [Deltaproteobacteria bacterium]